MVQAAGLKLPLQHRSTRNGLVHERRDAVGIEDYQGGDYNSTTVECYAHCMGGVRKKGDFL